MRRFIDFWWLCAGRAFWGNSAFANDWQWLVGYPVTAAILWGLGYFYAEFTGRVEVTLATGTLGVLAAALLAFLITWLAAFVGRLFNAPVLLYHEQKRRADGLEGVTPPRPKTSDKILASLQERYPSRVAPKTREYLDYEVDGTRAVNDVSLIFNGLTALANKHAKIMDRHTKKLNRRTDSEKRRDAISLMAADLILYADNVDDYAAIFRSLTPTLFECVSQFIERSPRLPAATYTALARALGGSMAATLNTLHSLEGNQRMAQKFKGVSADLNQAAMHLENVQSGLLYEINSYRNVCGELHSLVTRKSTNGSGTQNSQAI